MVETLADEPECSKQSTSSRSSASGEQDDEQDDENVERAEVKWDEAVAVDASLLGDAIEAFLKGISEPPVVEKRVSFKKC